MASTNAFHLKQQVTIRPFSSTTGAYPTSSFGASIGPLRARVIAKQGLVRLGRGQEADFSHEVIVHSPAYAITSKDQVVLPDGSQHPIVRIRESPNVIGRSEMYRLLLGNSRRTG